MRLHTGFVVVNCERFILSASHNQKKKIHKIKTVFNDWWLMWVRNARANRTKDKKSGTETIAISTEEKFKEEN